MNDVFSVKREGKRFHVKLSDPALARGTAEGVVKGASPGP
ncbi:hypothetical protein BH20PSE1_BH20PSE1_00870 [soil metagenome]